MKAVEVLVSLTPGPRNSGAPFVMIGDVFADWMRFRTSTSTSLLKSLPHFKVVSVGTARVIRGPFWNCQ